MTEQPITHARKRAVKTEIINLLMEGLRRQPDSITIELGCRAYRQILEGLSDMDLAREFSESDILDQDISRSALIDDLLGLSPLELAVETRLKDAAAEAAEAASLLQVLHRQLNMEVNLEKRPITTRVRRRLEKWISATHHSLFDAPAEEDRDTATPGLEPQQARTKAAQHLITGLSTFQHYTHSPTPQSNALDTARGTMDNALHAWANTAPPELLLHAYQAAGGNDPEVIQALKEPSTWREVLDERPYDEP